MSNTGWKNPSNATNQPKNGSGGTSWTSPGNVASSNNAYATFQIPGQAYSDWIRIYNFNCGISAGATINGIELKIERKSEHYGVHRDDDVTLAAGFSAKADKADFSTFYLMSDIIVSYGNSSDLWGTSWTPAEINDLNVFFSVANDACCNETVSIDHVQVCVWYTEAGEETANAIFFGINI